MKMALKLTIDWPVAMVLCRALMGQVALTTDNEIADSDEISAAHHQCARRITVQMMARQDSQIRRQTRSHLQ